MKRKCEETNENIRPGDQKSGNPNKKSRSSRANGEKYQEDSDDKKLMQDLGVKTLEIKKKVKDSSVNSDKVLLERDENTDCPEELETDSGLGAYDWDEGDSLDCSALSVDSPDANTSYPFKSARNAKGKFAQYLLPATSKLVRTKRDDPSGKVDLINQLSDEVILAVFKWIPKGILTRCARVCKRWNRLTVDESLWRRLDLGIASVTPGILDQVLGRGCQILRLARATVSSPVFTSPLLQPARLLYLDLSNAVINPTCLGQLLGACRKLRNLSLEMVELNDEVCGAIGSNRDLEVLQLGGSHGISSAGVGRLLSGCRKLVELNVGWTSLSQECLSSLILKLPSGIERLCLAGNRTTLTDDLVEQLCQKCPNLKELDISDAGDSVTGSSLTMILSSLSFLESLSTSRCYCIPPSSYLLLAHQCPTMQYLNVFGVLREPAEAELRERLKNIEINKFKFTAVARPTVGIKRTSIWNLRVRD